MERFKIEYILQKFNFFIKNYPVNQIRDKVHQLYKKILVQKIRKEKLEKFLKKYLLNKKFYNFFLEKEKTKTYQEVNKKLNVLSKIIEDLKNLYIFPDNDKMVINILKKIKEIKVRWEHSRNIFYSKVEDVFKTYRFHLENFFNYLKFNKNFQSLEYEHNIQKLHMISRVEELIKETKLTNNLNELYHLHHLLKKNARKKELPSNKELKNAFFTVIYSSFKFLERKFFERKYKIFKESIKSFYHKKLFYKKNIQYIKRKLQEYYINFLYENNLLEKFTDNSNYFFNKLTTYSILKKFNDFSIYTENIDTFLKELARRFLENGEVYCKKYKITFFSKFYKYYIVEFLEKKLFKYMEIISTEILKTRKKIRFYKSKEILNCFMTKYNYIIYIIEFLEILDHLDDDFSFYEIKMYLKIRRSLSKFRFFYMIFS